VVGASLGIAGCVGGGNDDGDGANSTDAPSAETDGDESADDSTGAPPAEETDDSTDQPGDDGDEAGDGTQDEEDTGDGSQDDTDGGSEPTLGDLDVIFENNYRFSVSVPQLGEPVTGAFNRGDFYSVVSVDGDTVTTYIVDGQQYIEADGTCTPVPSGTSGGLDVSSLADADTVEADVTDPESASLAPSRTTTIDGTEMYVYELASQDTTATYYIGVESQRLRRVQTQGTTIDYTDWGTVDPITAPC
jgi:hypothetical protein